MHVSTEWLQSSSGQNEEDYTTEDILSNGFRWRSKVGES